MNASDNRFQANCRSSLLKKSRRTKRRIKSMTNMNICNGRKKYPSILSSHKPSNLIIGFRHTSNDYHTDSATAYETRRRKTNG